MKPTVELPDDELMYNMLKDLPDFECFPIPEAWFKKFNIKPREATTFKEFAESNYAFICANAPKDLSPIIHNEPQRGGYTWPVEPIDAPKLEVLEATGPPTTQD